MGKDPDRNYVNDMQDPCFYDSPRQLLPVTQKNKDPSCHSPLRSPTDSDSVFNDELIHNSSEIGWLNELSTYDRYLPIFRGWDNFAGSLKNLRPSDSSMELSQKYDGVVDGAATLPPPRPPKPSHIQTPLYLNLSPTPLQIR